MKKIIAVATISSAIAVSGFALGPIAASAEDAQRTDFTRSEIEGIIRDYLLANPEIMYDVQAELERKHREEQQAAGQRVIAQSADDLFGSPHDGIIGNPEGDVTVVEFFDYNCGYCKRALSDMEALLDQDDNLRFVLKEFPILGPDSERAHTVSMAVHRVAPEQYGQFHKRLLGVNGRATEESAMEIARELGIDEAALRREMESPEIRAAFGATYELASRLQITGTPSYVVGNEVVFGALGKDVLNEKIENARQ